MIEDRLFELIDSALQEGGARVGSGEEFRDPPLDVLRYYRRIVPWSRVPVLGKAVSVVAVARQPLGLALSETAYLQLLKRLAQAAGGRFPPWNGLVIGLTGVVLTPEPIGPGDDAILGRVLAVPLRRYRAVPLGLFRVNLGQEAIAFALKSSPDQLFTEPLMLADLLSEQFRRYVPLVEA
jgi:hypothetical protein